ncbi:MAG: hypothetical protein WB995_02950, partial [Candidatus Acidiferrales bacterium]
STQGLTWSPNGDEIWFSAVKSGIYRSLFATTLGGRVRPLLSAPGNIDVQDALPDGRVLVADVSDRIILMVSTPEFPQPRDFTWMDWAYSMRFSADGKQILFGDQHSGEQYGTFLRNLDGSPAVRLGDGDPMDISADGKYALSRLPTIPNQLMLLPTGTGEPRQITHSNTSHVAARWLPDDRIIAVGNEPGHEPRTYLMDLNGNEKPITAEGVTAVAVTADGTRLVTITEGSADFELAPLDGGASQKMTQLQKGDRPVDFTPDDSAVFVRRDGRQGSIEIWRVELGSGRRTLIHTISLSEAPAITAGLGATVSRDGKSYAYSYARFISTEYVVEGLR